MPEPQQCVQVGNEFSWNMKYPIHSLQKVPQPRRLGLVSCNLLTHCLARANDMIHVVAVTRSIKHLVKHISHSSWFHGWWKDTWFKTFRILCQQIGCCDANACQWCKPTAFSVWSIVGCVIFPKETGVRRIVLSSWNLLRGWNIVGSIFPVLLTINIQLTFVRPSAVCSLLENGLFNPSGCECHTRKSRDANLEVVRSAGQDVLRAISVNPVSAPAACCRKRAVSIKRWRHSSWKAAGCVVRANNKLHVFLNLCWCSVKAFRITCSIVSLYL